MPPRSDTDVDVIIIGGGFAGSALAAVLGDKGVSTAVVDLNEQPPREFRPEKLGGKQLELLRGLGLEAVFTYGTTRTNVMLNM